jgi:hypothetical protein
VLPAPSITGHLIGTGVEREVRRWEKAIDRGHPDRNLGPAMRSWPAVLCHVPAAGVDEPQRHAVEYEVSPSQICFIFKLSLLVATSATIPSNLAINPLDQLFRS